MTAATHARALVLETPRHLVEHVVRAARDRRRRRAPAGRGVRALRHRPRAVHRPAPPRPARSSRATRPSGSSRRSAPPPPSGGACSAGDRVAVQVFQSCRECERLPARRPPPLQAARAWPRCTGSRAPRSPPGLWGGYATHHYLGPDSMLLPVPDGLDPVLATRVQPARGRHPVGRHGAGHHSRATWSRCSGPGIRGLRRVRGRQGRRRRVRDGHRRRRARPPAPRGGRALRRRPGGGRDRGGSGGGLPAGHRLGGADVVVDVTANAPAAFAQGVALARAGGTFVVAGTRGEPRRPASTPTTSSTRSCASSAPSASTPRPTAPPSTCSRAGRFPFEELRRQEVDLDGVDDLCSRPWPARATRRPSTASSARSRPT